MNNNLYELNADRSGREKVSEENRKTDPAVDEEDNFRLEMSGFA